MQSNDFLKNYGKVAPEQGGATKTEAPAPKAAEPPAPKAAEPTASKAVVQTAPKAAEPTAPKAAEPTAPKAAFYTTDSGFKPPKPKASPSAPTRKSHTGAIIAAAAGVVVLAVIIICVAVLGGKVTVPDFADYTATEASLWCTQNEVNLQKSEIFSDEIPAGGVISQDIPAGEKIKKNSFLGITFSLGSNPDIEVELPDLMNMTKEQIEAWASSNYMTKVRITTEASDKVGVGVVIRYEINDNTVLGDKVKRSTPIYVIISRGPDTASATVTVPNFNTMTVSAIYAFGRENGLDITVNEVFDDYISAGGVISQSVKAEQKVAKGSSITVVISKGTKVSVPDFSVLDKEAAQQRASDLGIRVTFKEAYSDKKNGEFISQSIAAGTVYDSGETVALSYSLGNEILLESFVGRQIYQLRDWIDEQNEKGAQLAINITYTENGAAYGTVISQDTYNRRISVNGVIKVVVSQGRQVFMPDFVVDVGMGYDKILSRDTIIEMCEQLNIVPVFVAEWSSGRHPGEVWRQSVAAGTEVSEGSTVTLYYVPANKTYEVPDFTGMYEKEVVKYQQYFNITVVIGPSPVDGLEEKAYDQSIIKGSTVAYGTAITVYISPPMLPTP